MVDPPDMQRAGLGDALLPCTSAGWRSALAAPEPVGAASSLEWRDCWRVAAPRAKRGWPVGPYLPLGQRPLELTSVAVGASYTLTWRELAICIAIANCRTRANDLRRSRATAGGRKPASAGWSLRQRPRAAVCIPSTRVALVVAGDEHVATDAAPSGLDLARAAPAGIMGTDAFPGGPQAQLGQAGIERAHPISFVDDAAAHRHVAHTSEVASDGEEYEHKHEEKEGEDETAVANEQEMLAICTHGETAWLTPDVRGVVGEYAFCRLFALPVELFDTRCRSGGAEERFDAVLPNGETVDVKTRLAPAGLAGCATAQDDHRVSLYVASSKLRNPAHHYALMAITLDSKDRAEAAPGLGRKPQRTSVPNASSCAACLLPRAPVVATATTAATTGSQRGGFGSMPLDVATQGRPRRDLSVWLDGDAVPLSVLRLASAKMFGPKRCVRERKRRVLAEADCGGCGSWHRAQSNLAVVYCGTAKREFVFSAQHRSTHQATHGGRAAPYYIVPCSRLTGPRTEPLVGP